MAGDLITALVTPLHRGARQIYRKACRHSPARQPHGPKRGRGQALVSLSRCPSATHKHRCLREGPDIASSVRQSAFLGCTTGQRRANACASCHFHAGADHRITNILASPPSTSTAIVVNQTVTASNFPFRQLSDEANNASAVVHDVRQVAGSAGIVPRSSPGWLPAALLKTVATWWVEHRRWAVECSPGRDRNAPSVINAVFNVRNFWDGRAAGSSRGKRPLEHRTWH